MRSAAALVLLAAAVQAQALAPAERRGRDLFRRGTDAAGRPLTAILNGAPSPTAPACAGCHGRDGRGRPEGGLVPADVRWQTLTRAREALGPRPARPAYDAARVTRAVTMGLDPAGRRLDPLMPRYALRREDAADLLAYLFRLGTLSDPGLAPDAVRMGVLVPAGADGARARAQVDAWTAGLAARGGVYARRVDAAFFATARDLDALDEEAEPFVLLGAAEPSARGAVAAWAARREVPWIEQPPGALPLATLERALERVGRDATRERLAGVLAGRGRTGR